MDINIDKYKNITRNLERDIVNLNPIQRGGILPTEAKKVIYEYWDGYSVCDYCSGRLDKIETPPINEFLDDMSKFLGMDITRPTHGARESKYAVMNAICKKGDYVVLDGNSHYTSYVALERANLNYVKTDVEEYPNFRVIPKSYAEKIDELEDSGKNIGLILLTHVDGSYGNVSDVSKVGKIAKSKGYPLLLNCAYSVGRMPVDGKKLNVDFIAASGHKSMAASGPCGLLSINAEYEDEILKTSKVNVVKELQMLGCTSRGIPILSLMASFPHIIERVKNWNLELEKTRKVVFEFEKLGFIALGEKPRNHDIIRFETPVLDKIAEKDKRRGFFFYEELKKRGIGGIRRGVTKEFKMSVYGLTGMQVDYIIDCIKSIVLENAN